MKILLFGTDGQLAWELRRSLSIFGTLHCLSRSDVDLSESDLVRRRIREFRPDVLVNAAAYTAVDRAELEPQVAMKINAEAPAVMAEEMKNLLGLFISYSTDFVYDGTKADAYTESDPTNPLNVYGASKCAGDEAVISAGGAYLILRTSWVYGSRGRNFMRTMLRLASSGKPMRVVNDQIGAPTWCRDLSNVTTHAISTLLAQGNPTRIDREKALALSGIYHASSAGDVSWWGFATAILEEGARLGLTRTPVPEVAPIPASDYPTPARRPRNSRLCKEKIEATFGISLPKWRDSLLLVLRELVAAKSDMAHF